MYRRLVEPTGLLPQPELPTADVARYALRGSADEGELEVVDCYRPVASEVSDDPSPGEIHEQPRDASADDVSAHEQTHRCPVGPCTADPLSEPGKVLTRSGGERRTARWRHREHYR